MTITLNGTTGITSTGITETSDGKVGIGTSSHYDASTKLTVAGRINTSNGTAIGSMNYGGGAVVNIGSLSNHPVQLMTNNTTRVVVDSAGRVTMPYQPAFQARLTSNNGLNNGSWSTLTGSNWTTDYNAGSNFNTANGTFTAPINGFYCFVGQLWFSGNTGGTYRYVGYRKNGSDRYVSSLHATSGIWNSDNTLSYSFTEYLTAGDSIYMIAFLDAASMVIGAGTERTRFSGYLIG